MGTIDVVLPLTVHDYVRFEILQKSLRRFFVPLGTCWVVTPDKELHTIRSRITERAYRVIPESTIIPELAFYNSVRRLVGRSHASTDGWFVQQLVKMAIADRIESSFYLTMDADVICTRTVHYSDLIVDDRAITDRFKHDVLREWYLWAERVLGLPSSGWVHQVTPALLSKEAMLRLHEYLSRRVSPVFRLAALTFPERSVTNAILASWRSFLLRNLPWTEYALYNTFLENMHLYETYHIEKEGQTLSGNSVWDKSDLESWQPEKSFQGNASFFFSVIQSNIGLGAAEVWQMVRPFLEGS